MRLECGYQKCDWRQGLLHEKQRLFGGETTSVLNPNFLSVETSFSTRASNCAHNSSNSRPTFLLTHSPQVISESVIQTLQILQKLVLRLSRNFVNNEGLLPTKNPIPSTDLIPDLHAFRSLIATALSIELLSLPRSSSSRNTGPDIFPLFIHLQNGN